MEEFEKIIDLMIYEIYDNFKGSGGKKFDILDMIELVKRDIDIGEMFNDRFDNLAEAHLQYKYLDPTDLKIMRDEKFSKLVELCHNKQ